MPMTAVLRIEVLLHTVRMPEATVYSRVRRSAAAGSWQQPATTPRFVISCPIIWEACVSWRQTRITCSNVTTTSRSENGGIPRRCLFRITATASTARKIRHSQACRSRTTVPVVTTNLTGGGSRRIRWRMNTLTIPNIVSVVIIRFL